MQYSDAQELLNLFNLLLDQPFPSIKTGIQILELHKKLYEINEIRTQLQNNIVKKYGHKNEDETYTVCPEDELYFDFIKSYNELQITEVEIYTSLTFDDLEGIPLTPNQIKSLQVLLTINS